MGLAAQQQQRPNIVYIMGDDIGLGQYRRTQIEEAMKRRAGN
jgi:hypothetical protein